ncbi:MAG TPA: D-glycero-beta-D-manno-heptose 1-phosphate adenylyltransferase, partial [Candidatus Woesearchaeota archaeon]|nr:D-glycero-beta-D-manno-heptose 1-phosphate adenylyltransferase [Candidatus Woesearchaeota archaeon]
EETPIKFLEEIKPSIHAKGGDYNINQIIEKDAVEKNNGKIVLIPKVTGYSTSDLINKIIKVYTNMVS